MLLRAFLFCFLSISLACGPPTLNRKKPSAFQNQLDSLQQMLQNDPDTMFLSLNWGNEVFQTHQPTQKGNWNDLFYFFRTADVTGPKQQHRFKHVVEEQSSGTLNFYLATEKNEPIQKMGFLLSPEGRILRLFAEHHKDSPFYASIIKAEASLLDPWSFELKVVQIHRITGVKEFIHCRWRAHRP